MSPSDIKTRSSALAVFVSTFTKRNQLQSTSFFKEKRGLRDTSPLRPWETELSPNLTRRKYSSLTKEYSKRTFRKENEKFIPFSFKSTNGKERSEKPKHIAASEFIHYSDITDYIKEYRTSRHFLSDAEQNRGCKEVQKAYESLGILTQIKRPFHEKLRHSENASGDVTRSSSNLGFQNDDDVVIADNVDYEDAGDERDDAESYHDHNDDVIPRCDGDNDLHQPRSIKIQSLTSENEQKFSNRNLLNLANAASPWKYQNAGGENLNALTKYRLASWSRKILNNSGQRNSERQKYRRAELPKVILKEENTQNRQKITKKTRENRIKLSKKDNKTFINALPKPLSGGPKSLKLPSLNQTQQIASKNKSKHRNATDLQPNNSPDFNCTLVSSAGDNYISSDARIILPHRTRSVRDMLMTSVKDLQPFSENKILEAPSEETMAGKEEDSSQKMSVPEQGISEIPKQSLSLRIYQHLMYKPSMRKLVGELYTPQKKSRSRDATSYVISGKPLYTLPPVKTYSQQVENRSIYRRKLHRKKPLENYSSTISIAESQHHRVVDNGKTSNRMVTLNPHTRSMESLAIIPRIQTVTKSQIFLKNTA